jgi:EAL domain-containing protein (putative c-di-GMP-specific phosphodiesterase class I)
VFDDPEIAVAIGRQLVSAVAADMRNWLSGGLNPGRVAVNISSAEFSQPALADGITAMLKQHGISPENFEVEVTETVLLGRAADAVSTTLRQFHERGILVTLDDFGTGYASLTHLKQFPVGHIKIDRSFVMNLEQDAGDEAIVAAIIGLGKNMGMQLTAEGVETVGQADRLRALGCHSAQGYLYSKPVAASLVPKLLAGSGHDHGD